MLKELERANKSKRKVMNGEMASKVKTEAGMVSDKRKRKAKSVALGEDFVGRGEKGKSKGHASGIVGGVARPTYHEFVY